MTKVSPPQVQRIIWLPQSTKIVIRQLLSLYCLNSAVDNEGEGNVAIGPIFIFISRDLIIYPGSVMYYSKRPLPSDVIPMERMQIFFIFILSYRHCIHRLLLLL